MKKFLFGAIAGVGIILLVMYCSTEERKASTWKPYKSNIITWQKLDTFVFENPTFKVEYPDFFVPDSSQYDNGTMQFKYMFNGNPIILRCFSANNDECWDDSIAADSAVYFRQTITNDSVTLRDMHQGYFYLGGYSKEIGIRFYEQYVVNKDNIYILELVYASSLDEDQVKNLKNLVHEWSPK